MMGQFLVKRELIFIAKVLYRRLADYTELYWNALRTPGSRHIIKLGLRHRTVSLLYNTLADP